jgi:hypothetical protein
MEYCKGPFTLQLPVERTKDSSNFLAGEKKPVHWAFILEAKQPPKRLHGSTSQEFWL